MGVGVIIGELLIHTRSSKKLFIKATACSLSRVNRTHKKHVLKIKCISNQRGTGGTDPPPEKSQIYMVS